ncbi:hypothetical protein ACRALDRAFT_1050708 [Sodiomyces alcalophilus JCM 7366]|uniref:uncharacterized protein n=1 Tax=Sodiomyces alcalophilus JCM 7366 TaxID=591952 RepID=UPI0039B4C6A5
MGVPGSPAGALGELQQNQQDVAGLRSPRKLRDENNGGSGKERGRSPTKSAFATLSRMAMKDSSKMYKSREPSPEKQNKTKSSTNLAGLLSRPKSFKSLNKQAKEDEARAVKDKENQTPPASTTTMDLGGPPPPIYAQFSSRDLGRQPLDGRSSFDMGSAHGSRGTNDGMQMPTRARKARPWSFQSLKTEPEVRLKDLRGPNTAGKKHSINDHKPASSERISSKAQRPKLFTAFSSTEQRRGHSSPKSAASMTIDPKDINTHLEAMLDRRNIPENQRFKMRNLNDTIKMEFIRQDWAEMAVQAEHNGNDDRTSTEASSSAVTASSDSEESRTKRGRGRSFTLGRAKKESKSPSKKSRGEGTLGRHFRTKSTESFVGERPTSVSSLTSGGILSKMKLGQGPGDFVSYLRKVRKPEAVEVGKLHKLRLLLRNETVSWAEDFIRQGGMEEIVGLLYRIIEVEWREEHEDALLHENLLCLKALCTTSLALHYLDSIQSDLLPRLIHMIFDPEKKGPSEFTTRNIITSVIFTYIESAAPQERVIRSKAVLSYLRNPEPKEDERPVPFVLEMRKERPYTVWNKEVVNVTKEVFWIFLHHLNVVALPAEMSSQGGFQLDQNPSTTNTTTNTGEQPYAYMYRHFPQPPPPVPAAPYVGGVEWDATNYLASHLDLVNAIIACTPTAEQRNALRNDLRISGWERCLGGSLRLCKEKFYGCVHEALRTWVAAAAEDGWDVRDVRYGPPADSSRSPRKKTGGGQKPGGGNGAQEAAPRIEMPRLDFGPSTPTQEQRQQQKKGGDPWLS